MIFKKKSGADSRKLWETYIKALLKPDFQKARAALESLKEAEPRNPQVYMKLGDLLQRTGDAAQAVMSYHRAASILTNVGFGHKALAIYKIIIRIDPNDDEAHKKTNEVIAGLEASKSPIPGAIIASEEIAEETAFMEGDTATGGKDWPMDNEEPPLPPGAEPPPLVVPQVFSSLSREALMSLFTKAVLRAYHDGESVVEEGDAGDSMFVIKSGKARVASHIMGKSYELATLGAGDLFGEVAFLTGRPRTASVYAVGDLEVYDLSRIALQEIIDTNREVRDGLANFYYRRVQDTIKTVKTGHGPERNRPPTVKK